MQNIRPSLAIYIDYSIRIPNFSKSFEQLKEYLFKDNFQDFDIEGDLSIVDFWKNEVKNPEIEAFYLAQKKPINDYDYRLKNPEELFYNSQHYLHFLDEFSFNLFVEPDTFCKKDIDFINLAQKHLFDIYLIDEFNMVRKKGNTCFFLSKARINFKALEFIHEGQELDTSRFLGVWNPKKNKDQENGNDLNLFQDWLIELEKKTKK